MLLATIPRGAELTAEVDELDPQTMYTFRVYTVVDDDIRSTPSRRDIETGWFYTTKVKNVKKKEKKPRNTKPDKKQLDTK